ncbi:TPA: hypothetical protein DCY43_03725 [candidate division WWE3 bacterium]|uniref:L,D-TPase catalytic domain-containing protein n=2 Tax=Katanobacteria TaxID=422282 RepID=A0A1F4V7P1_UNCKA|nr:MAG: hypothetical protein A2709_02555 [candidate division WWE3 bacterium RIFCSPHIGHO2_01_FULL_43_9]HAZ29820.1 hypothetical protein [candidate division WWE3 bacterium]
MKKIALLIAVFGLSLFLIPVLLRSFVAKSPTLIANSFSQDGTYNPKAGLAFYDYRFMRVPPYAPTQHLSASVLGKDSSKKRIEVDLTKQKLYAYKGNKKVYSFLVSTGKWGLTPTGNFRIWNKLKYTLMAGGSVSLGTYYYLPNVPYTMFFYGDNAAKSMGFGIHGTYWHDNFGHPMSHGCVNMKTEEAALLFDWADPALPENANSIVASEDNLGTEVIIYGDTPES